MSQETEFLQAVQRGDAIAVRSALVENPSLAGILSEGGTSPTMLAVYSGHSDVAQAILAHEPVLSIHEGAAVGKRSAIADALRRDPASLDSFSSDGWTALHFAAYFNHPDLVQMLIDAGADPQIESRNDEKVWPMQSALSNNSLASASLLIKSGASLEAPPDGNGWTALHYVASKGQVQLINDFLMHGANINARTKDGKTPLTIARENNQSLIANDIMANGGIE